MDNFRIYNFLCESLLYEAKKSKKWSQLTDKEKDAIIVVSKDKDLLYKITKHKATKPGVAIFGAIQGAIRGAKYGSNSLDAVLGSIALAALFPLIVYAVETFGDRRIDKAEKRLRLNKYDKDGKWVGGKV